MTHLSNTEQFRWQNDTVVLFHFILILFIYLCIYLLYCCILSIFHQINLFASTQAHTSRNNKCKTKWKLNEYNNYKQKVLAWLKGSRTALTWAPKNKQNNYNNKVQNKEEKKEKQRAFYFHFIYLFIYYIVFYPYFILFYLLIT